MKQGTQLIPLTSEELIRIVQDPPAVNLPGQVSWSMTLPFRFVFVEDFERLVLTARLGLAPAETMAVEMADLRRRTAEAESEWQKERKAHRDVVALATELDRQLRSRK